MLLITIGISGICQGNIEIYNYIFGICLLCGPSMQLRIFQEPWEPAAVVPGLFDKDFLRLFKKKYYQKKFGCGFLNNPLSIAGPHSLYKSFIYNTFIYIFILRISSPI